MSYDTVFICSFLSNLPSKYYIAACKIWPSYFDLVFQTTQATGLRQEQYICICGFIKAKVKIKYIILHWELQNLPPKKKLQLVNKDQAKQVQLCLPCRMIVLRFLLGCPGNPQHVLLLLWFMQMIKMTDQLTRLHLYMIYPTVLTYLYRTLYVIFINNQMKLGRFD